MARIFKRKEGQATFTASTQSRIQLSMNYHIQSLVCKLEVTHTNATAVFKSEHFANLINSVQIVANGNRTVKHIDAKKLVYNALLASGKAMSNTVETGDGSKVSTIYFGIDFSMLGMIRPVDTIENSALYQTFDMLIDWASSSNVGTGITISSASISVSSNQLIGYSRNVNERIAHNVETQLTEEVTSSTTEMQIKLPTQKAYRGLLIASLLDGVRSNAVINGVKLKSGTTVFAEWTADDLRALNLTRHAVRTEADMDGLLYLDFCERGRISDVLDTRGTQFNTLELVLDVTKTADKTNNVVIYQDVFDVESAVEVKG